MIDLDTDESHGVALRDIAPDLTPMLDILFMLLVFFLLTAGSVLQSLELNLPSAVEEELADVRTPKHILLEIRTETYALDGEEMPDFAALKETLDSAVAAKPEHELIVAGDRKIAIERLLRVLTYLQSRGIDAANILMQKETEQ